MVSLLEESIAVNLLALKIFGLYPYEKPSIFTITYSYIIYFGCSCLLPILAGINFFTDNSVDLYKVVQNTFTGLEYGCLIFRYFPFVFRRQAIRTAIFSLELPVFNNFKEHQKDIRDLTIKVCRLVSRVYLLVVFTASTSWVLTPLILGDHSLPLDLWLPFSIENDTNFYLVYSYLIVAGLEGAFSDGTVDTLVASLAWHAACQVKLLKRNLTNLNEHADKEVPEGTDSAERAAVKSQIVFNKIVQCVIHYKAIMDFAAAYDKAFTYVIFSQFAVSTVVICISLFHLMEGPKLNPKEEELSQLLIPVKVVSKQNNENNPTFRCSRVAHMFPVISVMQMEPLSYQYFAVIMFILTMLSQIFLYSFFGSMLYEESNGLITAIYMSDWLEFDMKSKKALILLMERAKKPILLTAAKILDISLDTFVSILKKAYSLLAVLNNFKKYQGQ